MHFAVFLRREGEVLLGMKKRGFGQAGYSCMLHRDAAKSSFYLVARPLRPHLPPPSSLVATTNFPEFFLELQKTVFFLVTGPLKKDRFFAASLRNIVSQYIYFREIITYNTTKYHRQS